MGACSTADNIALGSQGMIRLLDNFFDDPRPKVAIFPKETGMGHRTGPQDIGQGP